MDFPIAFPSNGGTALTGELASMEDIS